MHLGIDPSLRRDDKAGKGSDKRGLVVEKHQSLASASATLRSLDRRGTLF
jgi:hypothetical protein